MTRPPPHERPAANELARDQPQQIAGRPASVCPYCGSGMLVDGVNRTQHEIVRYIVCRNRSCGKRFISKQPPAKIMREVGGDSAEPAMLRVV